MVTIHTAHKEDPKRTVCIKLTDQQIEDLEGEMEEYNNKFDHLEPFTTIEEYIVHLLEVLERDVS